LAGTFAWKEGLDLPVTTARYFYAVIAASTLLGIAMVFVKINPVKALFWASTINGILAPFLLIGVLLVSCDRKLTQRQPSPWLSRVMVGLTAALMLLAAVAMFVR
jgi:Mn2+/Fe2+ NRAMP family transporter